MTCRAAGRRAEDGHELRGRHLQCHGPKNAFIRSRLRRVPRREQRQRAEQADPRSWAGTAGRRPVQPGELVGAGRDEYVPLSADELRDRCVVELSWRPVREPACQVRGLARW